MTMGNVLVIGNSGVGKSTLINAVLGKEKAVTGWGAEGTTKELRIYESEEIPFRLIDTMGFEPDPKKSKDAVNSVKDWSKKCAKEGNEDNAINVIWFCVEGTSSKLFPRAIEDLSKATAMWESVPLIVVITKSYAVPERQQNIEMVYNAFAKQKKYSNNLKKVIPVVASTFVVNDTAYAPPAGISELIQATNELLPDGIRGGAEDVAAFKLKRKNALAYTAIAAATLAGASIGAMSLRFSDAVLLNPIETAEINGIASIYGIPHTDESSLFIKRIVEAGTVSVAAKGVIAAVKAIPGLHLPGAVVNGATAGVIVAVLGESSRQVFEKIYTGEKDLSDIQWMQDFIEKAFASGIIEKVTTVLESLNNKSDVGSIVAAIMKLFTDNGSEPQAG